MLALALIAALPAQAASPPIAPGSYALVMRFTFEADAPLVGKVTTETLSTALVDVDVKDDGKIMAKQRGCGFVTDGGLFVTRAGPAFLKAMPVATYELVVDGDKVTGDMGIESIGVDPHVKSLPKDADSRAYTDPDGDGHKGAPLEVDVGGMKLRLDIAHLGRAVLHGTIHGDRVEGEPKVVMSEERILGGLPEFVGQGTKRIARSSFTMAPLHASPGQATCRDVERADDVAVHATPPPSRAHAHT